jgi:hypothetical protein
MGRPGSDQGWDLETDATAVANYFRQWQSAMQQTAQQRGNRWWLGEERIGLKLKSKQAHGVKHASLATNPECSPAAVEINIPSDPGDVDGNSQVGHDPAGRVWLLRQGRLKGNTINPLRIDAQQFQDLTGIPRAYETRSSGNERARWWFRVCRLDVEEGFIREQTVEFVRRCQQARQLASAATVPNSSGDGADHAVYLNGALEPTGPYVIPPHDGRVAERLHGEVVNALHRRLNEHGIPNHKVRLIAGYEVDLLVGGSRSSALLVEVKTGAMARDVQTGIGQLVLYRSLMPRSQCYTPVLLMPARPTRELEAAVSECGIAWHVYEWTGQCPGQGAIRFDVSFMSLCGLG